MRRLGILGGMAWPSTAEAYRLINVEVQRRLGGVHSADLVIRSFDFALIEALQESGEWERAGRLLADAAMDLQNAGAGALLLCTNTMHRVAEAIESAVDIPLLHIADATADAIRRDGIRTVGLLGTAFTMEQEFYVGRLARHGLDVRVPDASGRADVHRTIYDELVHGVVADGSRGRFREVAAALVADGVQGIIAGCTEIELLLGPDDVEVAYYPTTRLHTMAAVEWMLGDGSPDG